MNFKIWLENSNLSIKISKLYGWKPKVDEVIEDIQQGRLSYDTGKPVVVSRMDEPRGFFYLLDGYHRVFEAKLRNEQYISAIIDIHTPRIQRTGGAYNSFLNQKVLLSD